MAYRIIDSGAAGGIIVSPLGLQEGAEKVAAAENIFNVRLDEDSTRHQFTMQFLNKFMVGACVNFCISGHAEASVADAQGNDITPRG